MHWTWQSDLPMGWLQRQSWLLRGLLRPMLRGLRPMLRWLLRVMLRRLLRGLHKPVYFC
jgi:hypothetical protein